MNWKARLRENGRLFEKEDLRAAYLVWKGFQNQGIVNLRYILLISVEQESKQILQEL